MHPDSSSEFDSSSSCSTASPGGDTPGRSQHPPDPPASPGDEDTESRVPTVTAVSSSPGLRYVAQPPVVTPAPESSGRAKPGSPAANRSSKKSKPSTSRGGKDQPSREEEERKRRGGGEEEERRRIRRERNKIAAAKCRNRRRELIDTLQAETDQLEDEKSALQLQIDDLLKEKQRLERLLEAHKPSCRLSEEEEEEEEEEEDDAMLLEPPPPLQLLSILEEGKSPGSGVNGGLCVPAAAILGNSNIFLCPVRKRRRRREEALDDLRGDDLDDLVPSLEMAAASELAASVPDIDLGGPFCFPDWETLYKSVANDLESLSAPVSTCSSDRTTFSFNYAEMDSSMEGLEGLRGGLGVSEAMKDSLNSPTLLAL